MMGEKQASRIMRQCRENAVEWTAELVRRASVNPPGGEYEAAAYCAGILRDIGCAVTVDEFAPGRANVVAYAGNPNDVAIAFNGHLDVVAAEGEWKHPPFSATIAGGVMYGRGSADMKSGCACMMAAVKVLYGLGCFAGRGLCLTLVSDEELVNKGVRRLADTVRLRADACIVGEPTSLQVHYGNRGYTSFFVRTYGVAAHASEPQQGKNAIYQMARVVGRLELYAEKLRERVDGQLGSMSLSVGTIRGGVTLNTVPAFCEIEVECRVFPGMDAESVREQLLTFLSDEEGVEVEVRSNLPASLVPMDHPLVLAAKKHCSAVLGTEATVTKFPACSEASYFSVGYGIPTILLGPGNIACAHRIDEHVALDEIHKAVDIYTAIAREYLE